MARKPDKPKPAAKGNPRRGSTAARVAATERVPPAVAVPVVDVPPDRGDDAERAGEDGLTFREREFVKQVTGPWLGKATDAAMAAGYSTENRNAAKVTACRLLQRPRVAEAVATALAARRLAPGETLAAVANLSRSSWANFYSREDGAEPTIDWEKAEAAAAIGHIREWKEEAIQVGTGPAKVIKRSFKLHDGVRALELLAKMQGLVKVDVNAKLDVSHDVRPGVNAALADPRARAAAAVLADLLPEIVPDAGGG